MDCSSLRQVGEFQAMPPHLGDFRGKLISAFLFFFSLAGGEKLSLFCFPEEKSAAAYFFPSSRLLAFYEQMTAEVSFFTFLQDAKKSSVSLASLLPLSHQLLK